MKQILKAPRKACSIDLGMIEAIKFKQQPDTVRLLENAVALELYGKGRRFYSYKFAGGKECDFVLREGLATTVPEIIGRNSPPYRSPRPANEFR